MSTATKLAALAMIATLQLVSSATAERTVVQCFMSPKRRMTVTGNGETMAEYDRYFQTQLVLLRSPCGLDDCIGGSSGKISQPCEIVEFGVLCQNLLPWGGCA